MTYTMNEINALCRLFIIHLNEVYTVKEMRDMARNQIIGFTRCEIKAEIEANDLANDLG